MRNPLLLPCVFELDDNTSCRNLENLSPKRFVDNSLELTWTSTNLGSSKVILVSTWIKIVRTGMHTISGFLCWRYLDFILKSSQNGLEFFKSCRLYILMFYI